MRSVIRHLRASHNRSHNRSQRPVASMRFEPLSLRAATFMALPGLVLVVAGCSADAPKTPPAPPAVPVTVSVARQQDVPIEVKSIGNVESSSSVSLRSQVGGVLKGVHFEQGQNVRKGQVLITIDPRPYQAALDDALARLARDRAVAGNAAADVARYDDLAKKNKDYVTQQQMDKVKADADSARQNVVSDEALVERARLDLGYATIRAPISGRAGDVLVHAGNLVSASDPQPLVVILQTRSGAVPARDPQGRFRAHARRHRHRTEYLRPGPQGPAQLRRQRGEHGDGNHPAQGHVPERG